MGKRAKQHPRCAACRMHDTLCICAQIPQLALPTELVLLIYKREVGKPTGTGLLATQALVNSQVHVHGHADTPVDLTGTLEGPHRPILLFPDDDAPVLSEALRDDPRPISLIVPDGSWRQARRMARRIPGLENVQRVCLPEGPPSRYRLRREPLHGGLATLEAIARAFGILEGATVQQQLETLLDLMVERTLSTRGT